MTSTRVTQCVAVAAMLLTITHEVRAQSCIGMPALGTASRTLSTIADAYGSERAVLGRAGFNGERVFGGVQAGYIGDKVQDPRSAIGGFDVGITFKLGRAPKALQLCPLLQSLVQFGTGSSRTMHTTLGLSIGQEFRLSERFAIAPYVFGGLSRWDYNGRGVLPTNNLNAASVRAYHSNEMGARFGAGFGLRVGDALTIRPSFFYSGGFKDTGGEAGQPGAALSISYGFGKR